MSAGRASGAGARDDRRVPRLVLPARAAREPDGDERPDAEVDRRPDQEERHVEVGRLPAQQRIVGGRRRWPTGRDRAGRGAIGRKSSAITGSVATAFSAIRRTTIPQPPCVAYWISTKKRRRAPGSGRTGTTRATRRELLRVAARRAERESDDARRRPTPTPIDRQAVPRVPGRDRGLLGVERDAARGSRAAHSQRLSRSTRRAPAASSSCRRRRRVEPGIPRFDRDEEGVVGHALEDARSGRADGGAWAAGSAPSMPKTAPSAPTRTAQLEGDRNEGRPGEVAACR